MEEGIVFNMLTNPVEVLSDENGWVRGLRCIRMELGEPDESGRRRPVPVEGSEFDIEADTVIMALGTSSNPLIPPYHQRAGDHQARLPGSRRERSDHAPRSVRRRRCGDGSRHRDSRDGRRTHCREGY